VKNVNDTELNNLRKQLWANGYFPVPNLDKACVHKTWNTPKFYEREAKRYGGIDAAIESWTRRLPYRATGVRIQGGLGVIDGDIDNAKLMARLIEIIRRIAPDVLERAPVRYGGGEHKVAWFVRIEGELFGSIHTHKYVRSLDEVEAYKAAGVAWKAAGANPAAQPSYEYHHVEMFGSKLTSHGACPRQFGAFGWHTAPDNKAGKPPREYAWADVSLLDVPLAELPTLTKAQAYEIAKDFETAAVEEGWVAVPKQDHDSSDGRVREVFDIDRKKSRFDTKDSGVVSYAELEALVILANGGDVRMSANWIEGEVSVSDDRCNASWSKKFDCVQIRDFDGGGTWHYPNDIPRGDLKDIADKMEAVKEKVQQQQQAPPEEPLADDGAPPEPPPKAAQVNTAGLLTQDLVALVVAERGDGEMRYCHDSGGWFMWDGVSWKADRLKWGFHTCREISRLMSKEEREKKAIRAMRSAGFFSAVERIAATDPRLAVTSAHWDQDAYLMGTPSGTLDLRTGEVRAPDAADGISKLAAIAPSRTSTRLLPTIPAEAIGWR